MSLIKSTDSLIYYSYSVKEVYLLYEDETVQIPSERLTAFTCLNDFINNLFPIVKIKITIDTGTYYKILENKDTIKFKIRLQKFYRKNTNQEIVSLNDDFISKTFSLILDDIDIDLEKEKRELTYKNTKQETDLFAAKNDVEFFLFDSQLMKSMKKTINMILKNGTVSNVISYIASELNISNLLMSKADNIKEYDQLIIPPMKLSSALAYLDTFYGIHEKGSIIYFGIDRGYIIKFDGPCTAYERNEKKDITIIVPKALETSANHICELKKPDQPTNKFLICDYNTIEFRDESVSKNLLSGKEVRIVNLYDGTIENTVDDDDSIKEIITNRGENTYFKSIYQSQMLSNETVINLTLRDIDFSNITPNKRFKFVFEDTELSRKYKGDYILVKFNMTLIRNGNELRGVADCTFRKS